MIDKGIAFLLYLLIVTIMLLVVRIATKIIDIEKEIKEIHKTFDYISKSERNVVSTDRLRDIIAQARIKAKLYASDEKILFGWCRCVDFFCEEMITRGRTEKDTNGQMPKKYRKEK